MTKEIALNGSQAVELATGDMHEGEVERIRIQALHEVITAKIENVKAETAGRESAAPNNAHGDLAKDIALETMLPGAKLVSTIAEFCSERAQDVAAKGIDMKPGMMSMEQNIRGTMRQPGTYGGIASAKGGGMGIFEKANLAFSSLRDQSSENLKSWDCESGQKKFEGVSMAKQLTLGREYASQKALDSVHVATAEIGVRKYMAQQNHMAPGMNMGFAPRNTAALMSETSPYSDSTGTV